MNFFKWLHHVLNPHCEHCIREVEKQHELDLEIERETRACKTCEVYRTELDHFKRENERLLQTIVELSSPKSQELSEANFELQVPVKTTRYASFREKRRILEEQDRVAAEKLAQLKKDQKAGEEITGLEELEEKVVGTQL